MKTFFETFAVAFSMFSRIPVRQFEWTEKNQKYMMLAFPAVGLVLGLAWLLVAAACDELGIPSLLTGALLTALPMLLVGGIHLDGYADTWDALASHGDREAKLAIMKDPHTGSFAVLHLILWFLLCFAANVTLAEQEAIHWLPVALLFVLSRALSGLAVATFPMAADTGLVRSFADTADRKKVRNGLLFLLAVLAICFLALDLAAETFPTGLAICAAAALVFVWYRFISEKHFGGITGDLAGWFLCRCEVWMLVAAALVAGL